ncbi:Zinc (Zn2)-Iron (Fe2) Permease (ZIP) Family [Thraustotheca clavata]|uniref:Zinc (Zn2)-Iron (Fe2) Permease (ZIP) Family n=1 Tax=Thraustotheca clavata TaxID=74557 RepID=A0A1V9YDF0_9STRA|nr:Zinc (Zn2)-Iron (Fe2) Permease (ZIP) Family [Thraustotheca clavata]
MSSVWVEALLATAIVGAAPVLILLFVPLGRSSNVETQKPMLRVFLSFAGGGLLGDALLHLLPHSLPGHGHHNHDHKHDHNHSHNQDEGHSHSVSELSPFLYVLAGLMTFLMLEKFVRAQTGHSHGHSHDNAAHKKDDDAPESTPNISAAGYLNLAADFSHNFTDGLAIGATFIHGSGSGWQTTLAMLLHEVPHEIGDFAILIQSGFTRKQAMWTQLYTALGAIFGTAVGLLIETEAAAWVTPFTAGGFIYIACTSVFPELLEDSSLMSSLLQLAAMTLGIALMLLIALYE